MNSHRIQNTQYIDDSCISNNGFLCISKLVSKVRFITFMPMHTLNKNHRSNDSKTKFKSVWACVCVCDGGCELYTSYSCVSLNIPILYRCSGVSIHNELIYTTNGNPCACMQSHVFRNGILHTFIIFHAQKYTKSTITLR